MPNQLPRYLKVLFNIFLIAYSGFLFAHHTTHLPTHTEATNALSNAIGGNGGLNNHMWLTIVDRDGQVILVTFSGTHRHDQWLGSRVISAQKANTAIAFSLPSTVDIGFKSPLATANLYSATQPSGSLFGLQFSNPVNPLIAYSGSERRYGQHNDPMVGKKIGGINVFGGGLALYSSDGSLIGAVGVSGDTSCTDHIVAWKVRYNLDLDYIPGGIASGTDNIIFDISTDPNTGLGVSTSGFGHPDCNDSIAKNIAENLPTTHPIGNSSS